jgi:uncharacterized protein YcfJ
MKKFLAVIMLASTGALAQDIQVINVIPRVVTVQQQQCQQVAVQVQDHSTAGTIIGGVAGGIIGHQIGKGSGRDVATAAGAVVGAMSGNYVGGLGTGVQYRNVCTFVPQQVQQGELVTVLYKGRQYQFMAQ